MVVFSDEVFKCLITHKSVNYDDDNDFKLVEI